MKPHLGQQCRVRAFIEKKHECVGNDGEVDLWNRVLVTRENPTPDKVFTLIHVAHMTEKRWPSEDAADPKVTRRRIYIVASGLWRQYRAFPEDVELIEGKAGANE